MEKAKQIEIWKHGEAMLRQGNLNAASRAYWNLLLLASTQEKPPLREELIDRILKCHKKGGPFRLEEAVEVEDAGVVEVADAGIYSMVLQQLRDAVSKIEEHRPAAADGENRRWVKFRDAGSNVVAHKLPRFFSWIVPGYLAGLSTPRNASDVRALEALGVTLVVTLMEESPLNASWFEGTGIRNLYFPIPNLKPPTVEEVDAFFKRVDEVTAEGVPGAIAVHCGGGVGRAGTVLACYLVRHGATVARQFCEACKKTAARLNRAVRSADCTGEDGCPNAEPPKMNATDAIELLRVGRPGSLETKWQEDFVKTYNSVLWRRYSDPAVDDTTAVGDDTANERPLSMTGKPVVPSFVVLVGLPGSGKSWLADKLVEAGGGWVRASQDVLGGDGCRAMVSTHAKQLGKGRKLILDRCNPTAAERKEWLEMAFKPKGAIAVYFDADIEVCRERIRSRFGHETIRSGGGGFALADMSKRMEPPTLGEGFSAIYGVHNFENAKALVDKWTGKGPEKDTEKNTEVPGKSEKVPEVKKKVEPAAGSSSASTSASTSASASSSTDVKEYKMIKFPRTHHFFDTGGKSVGDDDVVADTAKALKSLKSSDIKVHVEEKIDGANMGFRIDPSTNTIVAQNRTHFVSSKEQKQYGLLDPWVSDHRERLTHILEQGGSRKIIFGEWMVAKHSIQYTWVPDYFLAYDILDVDEGKFYSRHRFKKVIDAANALEEVDEPKIWTIRSVECGHGWASLSSKEEWKRVLMATPSAYRDGPVEGLYIRLDHKDWMVDRMKLVRPDFVAGSEEFSKHKIVKNVIDPEMFASKNPL